MDTLLGLERCCSEGIKLIGDSFVDVAPEMIFNGGGIGDKGVFAMAERISTLL